MKADTLLALRRHLGYSESQLARYLGVTQATVSRWESKKCHVPDIAAKMITMMIEMPAAKEWIVSHARTARKYRMKEPR